jgi:hypothetical protein
MELKGKFLIALDTICDGEQTSLDENGLPMLYDSEADAFLELFEDAIAGLEGTDDEYFEDNNLHREGIISTMKALKEDGNFLRMKTWLNAHPDANYYGEFIVPADEFVLGRKAIFTGQGIVIEGKRLEEI